MTLINQDNQSLTLRDLKDRYLVKLKVNQYSQSTIDLKCETLNNFIAWCLMLGVTKVIDVNKQLIERFQSCLTGYRKPNFEPLAISTQRTRLVSVKVFFDWLYEEEYITKNPVRKIIIPKANSSLPKHILTINEVEKVLNAIKIKRLTDLRNRTIIETFYSTGIRRMELINLQIYDIDFQLGTIRIRFGKGGKDRVVPIGSRALNWIIQYIKESRVKLLQDKNDCLFLSLLGKPLHKTTVTQICHAAIRKSGISKSGSCHIFRHTAATHMLEAGADIRCIQSMLGHACLSTTQIYTRVSIRHLKEVHARTHPAG
jgi:integrase/recombinase XerD